MSSAWQKTPYTGIYLLPNLGNVIHLECGQWAWMTIGCGWKDGLAKSKQQAIEACESALKNYKGHKKY